MKKAENRKPQRKKRTGFSDDGVTIHQRGQRAQLQVGKRARLPDGLQVLVHVHQLQRNDKEKNQPSVSPASARRDPPERIISYALHRSTAGTPCYPVADHPLESELPLKRAKSDCQARSLDSVEGNAGPILGQILKGGALSSPLLEVISTAEGSIIEEDSGDPRPATGILSGVLSSLERDCMHSDSKPFRM
jgi:hypothetical protein